MSKRRTERKLCTECRTWFRPEVTAVSIQLVCGEACRRVRRRKLARRRRDKELERYRVDERHRQRASRASRVRGARHAPPSPRNMLGSRQKLAQMWIEVVEVSRAAFERQVRRISRQYARQMEQPAGLDERRHAPP